MLKNLFILGILLPIATRTFAQSCTVQGDQTTYGTNDTWIGYVYDNTDLTNYKGYVLEGIPGNPDFDQSFGGLYVNYSTNGCPVYTEAFSVRYKLRKTFAPGDYDFTVSGDDGYRLSIDGGATWLIDSWNFYGFNANTATVSLNGTYDLVLEYYEYAHNNRIAISIAPACTAADDLSLYGLNNIWRGYVYNGINFNYYKGLRNVGTAGSADFDENFGGGYTRFNTSACSLLSEHFTVRYKLSKAFTANNYSIIVGSEDGYRLSLDGGTSWVIDNWSNTSYNSTTLMSNLNGTYDMVLEYKETTGANRITFSSGLAIVLPVEFLSFTAQDINTGILLQWEVGNLDEVDHFEVERSKDGQIFQQTGSIEAGRNSSKYAFTDAASVQGRLFYRIKVVDKTGKASYSKIIVIADNKKGINIFPSFVSNNIIYIANENGLSAAGITITDMSGRIIFRYALNNVPARQTSSIFLPSHLAKGMYVVRLEDGGSAVKTEKIFIQ